MTGVVVGQPERVRGRGNHMVRSACRGYGSPTLDFRDASLSAEWPFVAVAETPPVTPPVEVLTRLPNQAEELGNAEIRARPGLKTRAHLRERYVAPAVLPSAPVRQSNAFVAAAMTAPTSESRQESRPESRLESAAYLEIIPGGAGRRGSGGRVGESDGESGGESDGEKDGEELTANQQRILELLSQNPRMAAPELAEVVGITKRNIEHNVAALKKMGRLKRIGPARGGHWEVLE